MREIKFRVWDIDKKVFVKNLTLCLDDINAVKKEWHLLSQFTGLHDRNGKEIYEGDMVNLFGSFGVVLAGNGKPAVFEVKANGCDYVLKRPEFEFEWGRLSRIEELFWSCEVIGSIYENPELLNQTL